MIFGICYIVFNLYLVIHVVASFGNQTVLNMPVSTAEMECFVGDL